MKLIDNNYTILVIGSGGFIGRNLVYHLKQLKLNYREIKGQSDCDLRDLEKLRSRIISSKPDCIIFLAADTSISSSLENHNNLSPSSSAREIAHNFSECCKKIDDCHIIYLGSYKQYGLHDNVFTEDTICRPITRYGVDKKYIEEVVVNLTEFGHVYTSLRLSSVYGPHEPHIYFVPKLIQLLLSNSNEEIPVSDTAWDIIFVADVVNAIMHSISSCNSKNQIFNVGGGEKTCSRSVAQALMGIVDTNVRMVQYSSAGLTPQNAFGDTSKIRQMLGWNPKINLQQGLRHMVSYYSERMH